MTDASHLIVRTDGVLCTVCGCIIPVHPGDGTPLPAFLNALNNIPIRHPRRKHPDPYKKGQK